MPFNHSSLTPRERELMRRSAAARHLIRTVGLDAELALYWVTAPQQELDQAHRNLSEDHRPPLPGRKAP